MMGHRLNETPRPRLLCEVFDRREDVARMIKMVTRVQEDAMMMFDHRDPLLSGFDWTRFDAAMAEALRHLEGICPHAVCPLCKGAGCPTCGDRGWVNRELYDQATDTPRGLPEPAAVV
jgi:hypothetical protein